MDELRRLRDLGFAHVLVRHIVPQQALVLASYQRLGWRGGSYRPPGRTLRITRMIRRILGSGGYTQIFRPRPSSFFSCA